MWFKNKETGMSHQIDETNKKYADWINDLKNDNDYIEIEDPKTIAKKAAAEKAIQEELKELRKLKKETK